jgi:hypothetical protein
VNALMKKQKEFPEGLMPLDDVPRKLNIPRTTTRPYIDRGDIELYLINDTVVVKVDEVIAALISSGRTQRKTRLRVLAGLKEAGIAVEKEPAPDLFA